MDDRRLDAIARHLARAPRRRLLAGLAAALAAGLGAGGAAGGRRPRRCKRYPELCGHTFECCGGRRGLTSCEPKCFVDFSECCGLTGARCKPEHDSCDCCGNRVCNRGRCGDTCPRGRVTCNRRCAPAGYACCSAGGAEFACAPGRTLCCPETDGRP